NSELNTDTTHACRVVVPIWRLYTAKASRNLTLVHSFNSVFAYVMQCNKPWQISTARRESPIRNIESNKAVATCKPPFTNQASAPISNCWNLGQYLLQQGA